MKIKIVTLNILALSAISLLAVNPAEAQNRQRGARFDFAPQYYRMEETKVPEISHSVKSGSVPKGANFLGLDPSMLEKPKPQVIAHPVTTQVTPQIQFNSAFGAPAVAPAEAKKSAPLIAQEKLAMMKAAPRKVSRPVVAHRATRANTSVSATLMKRGGKAPNALDATGSQLASYDKNVGYAPGAYLPTQSSDGIQSHADVHGRLLKN